MNKILPLSCILLLCGIANAQIVNIPDANFKNALLNHNPVIDTNGDGEIQVAEAEVVSTMSVNGKNISSLSGIESFVNLMFLSVVDNPLSQINITTLVNLHGLNAGLTNISNVDLSSNINLEFLDFSFSPLTAIDVTMLLSIKRLTFVGCELASINVDSNPLLENLDLAGNVLIDEINIMNNNLLNVLDVSNTSIAVLDLSNNSSLEILNAYSNNLSTINLNNLTELKLLNVSNTQLSTLDVSNNLLLKILAFEDTLIAKIDTSSLTELQALGFKNTKIETIDLSQNTNLCNINGQGNNFLLYMNLRNGANNLLVGSTNCDIQITSNNSASYQSQLLMNGCLNLEFMCVDDVVFAQQNFNFVPSQVQFTEDCSLSIASQTIESIIMYPNPARDLISVSSNERIDTIEIFSVVGERVVYKVLDQKTSDIDTSSLSAGIYFVKLRQNQREEVIRIVRE